MSNVYTGATLAQIAEGVTTNPNTRADAIACLEERLAKAKPDSYKARRTQHALEQLRASGQLNVASAFEGAKKTARVVTQPTPESEGKPVTQAAIMRALKGSDPAMREAVMALLTLR